MKKIAILIGLLSTFPHAQGMQKTTTISAKLQVIQQLVDKAFEKDDANILASLLQRYSAYLDTKSLLDRAIRNDKINIIDFLLNRISDPDREIIALSYTLKALTAKGKKDDYLNSVRSKSGLTPLLQAIKDKKTKKINFLLRMDADPRATGTNKISSLIAASFSRLPEVVTDLLDIHYVPINAQGGLGRMSALMVAAKAGYPEIVEILLERGADTKLLDEKGYTALFFAAKRGHENIVQLLLQKDPELVDVRSNDGTTPLMIAAYGGHNQVVNMLLDYNANIEDANKLFVTPLLFAIANKKPLTVQLLLSRGANVNHANEQDGRTPLIIAVTLGYIEIVEILLDAGADPTIRDKARATALSLAEKLRDKNITQLLQNAISRKQTKTVEKTVELESSTDDLEPEQSPPVGAKSESEETPPQSTLEQLHKQAKIDTTTVLWEHVTTGIPKEVTKLLAKPFNVHKIDEQGNNLLMHAIKLAIHNPADRKMKVIQALLDNPDIVATINMQNHNGETAILLGLTNPTITKQLLTYGADPTVADEAGNTIIIRATQRDGITLKTILLLLKKQLDKDTYTNLLNRQNQEGNSALMYAIKKSAPENVILLLTHGADYNVLNKLDQTPLSLAYQIKELTRLPEEPNKEQVARAEEVVQILQEVIQSQTERPAGPIAQPKEAIPGDDPLLAELTKGDRAKATVVEAIIAKNPRDILRQRAGGTTPLMVAIESNVTEKVLRSLLEKLSQEHIQLVETKSRETALHKAIKNSRVGFVQLLLAQNVPFAQHDIGLARALLATAKKAKQKGKVKRLKAIIKLLEKAYSQQEQGNKLLTAAFAGDLTIIDTALSAGASINTQDENGNTPLMQAIKANKDVTARHLIERGARLNIQNHQGQTALALAVQKNNYDLVSYLLQHGADDRIEDSTGQTAYGYAIKYGNANIANRIRIHRALQNIQRTQNIAHTLQRHFDPRGDKKDALVGPEDQDVINKPYVSRLPDGTIASFFPQSWNSTDIYNAIIAILEHPAELHEQPARITEEGTVIRNALIIKGTYKDIPITVIISDVPRVGWILFTAYPDI